MINIRQFMIPDFEEVVNMYYDFTKEVYPERDIGEKYFFYKKVIEWINDSYDVVLAYNEKEIVGFTMCYQDMCNGLTEPIYQCELAYIKPEYRKTRTAYLLYNNAYEYAKQLGMQISSNGRVENGVDKMMLKHFNLKPKFTVLGG